MQTTKLIGEYPLYDGNRYIGMAFAYDDGSFTHSHQRHGTPREGSMIAAVIEFRRTYDALPSKVRGGPDRKCAFVYIGDNMHLNT